jgi:hypothetical protein
MLYVPLWFGLCSILSQTVYSSQRAGMQPKFMSSFVQDHLDMICGIGEVAATIGFIFMIVLLVLVKRYRRSKAFSLGGVAVLAGLLWSFIFQSL